MSMGEVCALSDRGRQCVGPRRVCSLVEEEEEVCEMKFVEERQCFSLAGLGKLAHALWVT